MKLITAVKNKRTLATFILPPPDQNIAWVETINREVYYVVAKTNLEKHTTLSKFSPAARARPDAPAPESPVGSARETPAKPVRRRFFQGSGLFPGWKTVLGGLISVPPQQVGYSKHATFGCITWWCRHRNPQSLARLVTRLPRQCSQTGASPRATMPEVYSVCTAVNLALIHMSWNHVMCAPGEGV